MESQLLTRNLTIKNNKKEAPKYIQQLIKNGAQPDVIWTYEQEMETLTDAAKYIEQEIGNNIKIIQSETSEHQKSSIAIPRRPGINFIY